MVIYCAAGGIVRADLSVLLVPRLCFFAIDLVFLIARGGNVNSWYLSDVCA